MTALSIISVLLVTLFFHNIMISNSNNVSREIPILLIEPTKFTPLNETEPEILTFTIDDFRGTVEVKPAGSEEWVPATKGMVLTEGAKISTGFRSKCALNFSDNSVFTVKSLTQMTVNRFLKDGDTIETKIKLRIGDVRLKVKEDQPVKTDLKVTTPNAVCSVRGTTFGVTVVDNATSIVEAFEGEVMVNSTTTGEWATFEGWGNGIGYRATAVNGTSMQVELAYLGPLYLWDFDWWISGPAVTGACVDRKPTHT
jgi:hypothetical protein